MSLIAPLGVEAGASSPYVPRISNRLLPGTAFKEGKLCHPCDISAGTCAGAYAGKAVQRGLVSFFGLAPEGLSEEAADGNPQPLMFHYRIVS
jgi:hypothetical protein